MKTTEKFIEDKKTEPTEFVKDEYVPITKTVYLKAGADMSDKGYEASTLANVLRFKMKREGKRFWANDNISEYLSEDDKELLINEATVAFEQVLQTLLIDTETDPSSKGTARRLAKMYINEVMSGRYDPVSYTHLTLPTNREV